MRYISYSSSGTPGNPPSLLRKAVAVVGVVVIAGVALMFSVVVLTVIAIIAVFGGAFLWWKTREFRRHMRALREQMRNSPPRTAAAGSDVFKGEVFEGEVIEGEAVRVQEPSAKR